jgi:hypothetical protein
LAAAKEETAAIRPRGGRPTDFNTGLTRAIEPHIPVFDKSARTDGTFSREDFVYDQKSDVYVRPAGKDLASTSTLVNDDATLLYRASAMLAN